MHLGLQGLLIRGTDAGKFRNLALAGLLVQTLGVTLLSDLNRDIDPDLNERNARLATRTFSLVQRAGEVTVRTVRRDEASDGNGAGVGKQFGHLGDAADVFLAVLRGEAEIFVEAEADVVAVETVGALAVGFADQGLFESDGDGRFA